MIPEDLTLSTPEANLLSVLPPRRRTGAHMEFLISGVTGMKSNETSPHRDSWKQALTRSHVAMKLRGS
ncbi:hypothetical protein VNO78_15535 [Psophocarpus tetragonolobus]|uniref:Uncharacterized protein n=1 Tax=Psophocarpus tetragonolobus TaxID=3891 RepID=A0AAN9XJV3_PSOTE